MGTPEFSVPALEALHKAGHEVVAVYSQPPRPKGRGHEVQKSPVQEKAEALGIPVFTPAKLKDEAEHKKFADLRADVAVVVAYGLLLPKAILAAPTYGCVNIHASLLPRWRGAAPIQRALLEGDAETGICLMQMDEGLDTGAVYAVEALPITTHTTASSLHDELSALGAKMMVEALPCMASGALKAKPQPNEGVTYAAKLTRDEGKINWNEPAAVIERRARALNPWPGLFFETESGRVKVLETAFVAGKEGAAGTLLSDDFTIACGEDALRLTKVQREGRAAMEGSAFLRGFPLKVGEKL
jgi:methionyl-tRNA formyltransferase